VRPTHTHTHTQQVDKCRVDIDKAEGAYDLLLASQVYEALSYGSLKALVAAS
jgi:hypothetical protein